MGASRFEYIVDDDTIAAFRIGTQQSLPFLASRHDVPIPKVDARRQMSRRGGVVATTVFGEWREGELECPYIEADEVDRWIEFLMSIRKGQQFKIIVTDFPGFVTRSIQILNVITTADQLELPRYRGDSCRAYTCTIPWREVAER